MFEKIALMGAASLLAFTGYTGNPFASADAPSQQGTIYHYVQSDGHASRPNHVYVYRTSDSQIEIYKTSGRCRDADFTTAWFLPDTGRASVVTSGRLMRNGRHEDFLNLAYDGTSQMLHAEVAQTDGMATNFIDVRESNWHLQDLDLATLSIQTMAMENPRAGFSFGITDLQPEGEELLDNLGMATAEYIGEETYQGATALRFNVTGAAFSQNDSALWLDPVTGAVIGAEWQFGDNAQADSYNLRLVDVEQGGEAGWHRLLSDHYQGCSTT